METMPACFDAAAVRSCGATGSRIEGAARDEPEGNLQAPTRHPIDWQNPQFYDEAAAFAEMERVFDICHGCRRCVSLCQSFPTLFDLVDATADGEVHARRQGGLLERGRPVLPVRPLLHDQVPLCAAASVEPGLPAPDAARQGDQASQGRGRRGREVPRLHRRARPVRRHPDRGPGRQRGQPDQAGAQADGQGAGRASRRLDAVARDQALPLERCPQGPGRRW